MKNLNQLGQEHCLGRFHCFFKNYFAAAWIANLGVVPLFLFAAFLLAPAFFFFLSLLLFVTHVLETIGKLLYNRNYRRRINTNNVIYQIPFFKLSFLPRISRCVKGFFVILLLNHMLWSGNALASDFILSRGQSMSLPLPKMARFNVGNKEVLTYKLNESNKTLLIRGASLGTSEILVWNKGEENPETYQIFVISKNQESKLLHIAQLMSSMGLKTLVDLPHLRVSGGLTSLKDYLQYKKIQAQNNELILDEVNIGPTLKKTILADIYKHFFNDYKDSIKCTLLYSEFTCLYPKNEAPGESLKKFLIEKYKVMFIEHNNQKFRKNYSFKMKIVQLEQMDGEELRLGLEQINATLGDILRVPLNLIVEKNAFLLAQKKVQMNTLAEPMGLIRPMSPAEFQIGADVPYTSASKDGINQTQWMFAGLKVKVVMENMGDKIKINYSTELTKPSLESNGPISGNKEKSSVVIDLNSPTQLFQISLKTEALGVDQMPFLNRIPLLGELFIFKKTRGVFTVLMYI